MIPFTLLLILLVAFLLTRLYTRATGPMTPTGQTILDVVLVLVIGFLLWGGNVRIG